MRHLNTKNCIWVGIKSFIAMLAALIAIPYLHEVETCVIAALVITTAYAWFTGVLWVNIFPRTKKRRKS